MKNLRLRTIKEKALVSKGQTLVNEEAEVRPRSSASPVLSSATPSPYDA